MFFKHYSISFTLLIILFFIFLKNKNTVHLYKAIFFLITLNLFIFNSYLLLTNTFNPKIHLPLHLCYLTQIGIFLSFFFKNNLLYSWLLLNSLGGGLTGFLNTNLDNNAMPIEYLYLHLSHFNLLLFVIFLYKRKFHIRKSEYIISMFFNAVIFFLIMFYNRIFDSNYWFTRTKPPGINLTTILPDWPYYLIILIIIGINSYYFTYKMFSKKTSKQ